MISEKEILDIIATEARLDRASITRSSRLDELDMQSIEIVEMVFALEDAFDISIPYNANERSQPAGISFETLGDVVDMVDALVVTKAGSAPTGVLQPGE